MSKRNYSMIDYFIQREKEITPVLHFKGKTKVEFEEWKSSFRSKLLELLGEFPEQVPLNAETIATVEKENYIIEKVVFDTEKYASVPAYLLIPKDLKKGKKWPAILCPHGHGPYGKEPVAGITLDDEDRVKNMRLHNYNYAQQMAEHGFVTLAPDERTFGERSDGGNPYPGRDKCNVHFIRGLILGINLIALNIWDMMKCIDYLQTREEVDKDRIGCMGLSFGGTMTTYTAALNERVKA
ncbi:MAG: alpha/beta hydrolase, partial [Candidatus Zixiibacteriota bacterium]